MLNRFTALAVAVLAMASPALAAPPMSDADARHLLDRAAFGPRPAEIAAVRALGASAWVERQLRPAGLSEPTGLRARLADLTSLRADPIALRDRTMKPLKAAAKGSDAQKQARRASRDALEEAQAGRLWRAIESPRELEQVMVDFWGNHFNVFAGKGPVKVWVGSYEETAIRPFALGRFRDLLGAVATHPAMQFYLDNHRNRRGALNENYARELLELHTLGVEGGYTQADVVSLARILTGWGIGKTGFQFNAKRHDAEAKTLLGRTFQAGGRAEGEAALDLLAAHPATARHLAWQLAVHFVSDAPPAPLVAKLAATYQATDGRIDAVLRVLFADPAFWASRGAKFKTPYRLVVSTARALGRDGAEPRPLVQTMKRLGQPLYGCVTPDGWADTTGAWLGPDAMATRVSLAVTAGREERPDPTALAGIFGGMLSAATQAAVAGAAPGLRAGLLLGSPEFQRH